MQRSHFISLHCSVRLCTLGCSPPMTSLFPSRLAKNPGLEISLNLAQYRIFEVSPLWQHSWAIPCASMIVYHSRHNKTLASFRMHWCDDLQSNNINKIIGGVAGGFLLAAPNFWYSGPQINLNNWIWCPVQICSTWAWFQHCFVADIELVHDICDLNPIQTITVH